MRDLQRNFMVFKEELQMPACHVRSAARAHGACGACCAYRGDRCPCLADAVREWGPGQAEK